VRHGKIVVEAYYAPYAAGIPHTIEYATKAVISTLTAVASKDGCSIVRAIECSFFDGRSIANVEPAEGAREQGF
jgi:hypothetical protein